MSWLCCCGGGGADGEAAISKPATPLQQPSPEPGPSTPDGLRRFILSEGRDRVTGVHNSGSKYAIDQPVQQHTMPYEERVQRALEEEERALELQRERELQQRRPAGPA